MNSQRAIDDLIDSAVDAFEHAKANHATVCVEDFLPERGSSSFKEVLIELLRVDMELSWRSGRPKRLPDYQAVFPGDLADPNVLTELAFEEFRLRRESGEKATVGEYKRNPLIQIDKWPNSDMSFVTTRENKDTLSLDEVEADVDALTRAICLLPQAESTFAEFRTTRQIGRGAFGRVFLARQDGLAERPVVLKFTAGDSPEPHRLAQLQHTNVVPIYSVHQRDDLQAVCMPYFGCCTLGHLIQAFELAGTIPTTGAVIMSTVRAESARIGGFAADVTDTETTRQLDSANYHQACLRLAKQIADGLAHAHERGIVHKDLKPANVLITDDGRAMLLDFNLSDRIVPGGIAVATVGGTLPYMSPEQLRSLKRLEPIDPRSDIFSFGVLLFQLLTLRLPFAFASENSIQRMLADRDQTPPRIKQFHPSVPPSIQSLVDRCLSFRPEDRYVSMNEVATDLELHLRDLPLRHTPNRSFGERFAKWRRRHPRALSASTVIGAAVVLLGVLASTLVWKSQRLRHLETAAVMREIRDRLPEVGVVLSSPYSELESLQDASLRLDQFAESMGILDDGRLISHSPNSMRADEFRSQFQEVAYLLSHARLRMAQGSATVNDRATRLDAALKFNQLAKELVIDDSSASAIDSQRERIERLSANTSEIVTSSPRIKGRSPLSIIELLYDGRYAQAASLLEEQHRQDPLDFATLFHLGEAYLAMGRLSEAESYFTTGISIWPNAYLPVFYRGICRLELKQYRFAESDFDRVLDLRPKFAPALINRALAKKERNRLSDALKDVSSVIDAGMAKPRLYFLRSRIKKRMGDVAGAASDHELGMQTPPTDEQDLVSRGVARMKTDPTSALSDFQEAIRWNSSSRDARRNIIYVLSELLNQPAEAKRTANELIDRLGETSTDLMARAVLAARLGDPVAAKRDADRVIKENPSDKVLFQAACVYAILGGNENTETACEYLRRAAAINMEWLARLADPDLGTLRSHPAFVELTKLAAQYDKAMKRE